jgi:putative AdoMet-dependent methyltransferase
MSISINPFPPSEFDEWAETYDASVSIDQFPFHGYQAVLARIVTLAEPHPNLSVLDLGTGTGNLGLLFARRRCKLWCTDFSASMLEKTRQKLPAAHLILHDLHLPLPVELQVPFDRIVSAYVFHHFKLEEKVHILGNLFPHLNPGGRIIIGDISFPDQATFEQVKKEAGDEWNEEFYWIAPKAIETLQKNNINVEYEQISSCAGIFTLRS